MHNRIKEIRNKLNLTQDKFAQKLGIAQNTLACYEMNRRKPSNAVILSICREFNVDEHWLRTGEGEMFNDLSKNEQVARAIGKALNTDDEFVLNTFLALAEMPESVWDDVKAFIDKIKK